MDDVGQVAKIVSLLIGSIGGVIMAFRAITEMKQGLKQRKIEHRWKQTSQAREFLKEMRLDYKSSSALMMIDWSGRSYQITNEKRDVITYDEVAEGLRTENYTFTPKESFIRDCFDSLYEKFEEIEHFIIHDFVLFEDISTPLVFYVKKIDKYPHYRKFMEKYKYDLAMRFIDRFKTL